MLAILALITAEFVLMLAKLALIAAELAPILAMFEERAAEIALVVSDIVFSMLSEFVLMLEVLS